MIGTNGNGNGKWYLLVCLYVIVGLVIRSQPTQPQYFGPGEGCGQCEEPLHVNRHQGSRYVRLSDDAEVRYRFGAVTRIMASKDKDRDRT